MKLNQAETYLMARAVVAYMSSAILKTPEETAAIVALYERMQREMPSGISTVCISNKTNPVENLVLAPDDLPFGGWALNEEEHPARRIHDAPKGAPPAAQG